LYVFLASFFVLDSFGYDFELHIKCHTTTLTRVCVALLNAAHRCPRGPATTEWGGLALDFPQWRRGWGAKGTVIQVRKTSPGTFEKTFLRGFVFAHGNNVPQSYVRRKSPIIISLAYTRRSLNFSFAPRALPHLLDPGNSEPQFM
jgi:hypothetical protein